MKCIKCKLKNVCEDCGDEIPQPVFNPDFLKKQIKDKNNIMPCLHDSCNGCKNGTCSGVHMISCSCPKCSPTCFDINNRANKLT